MLPCYILGGEVNVSFCNENSYNNSTHSYYLNPLSLSTLTDPHKLTVPTSLKQLTNTVPTPIVPSLVQRLLTPRIPAARGTYSIRVYNKRGMSQSAPG